MLVRALRAGGRANRAHGGAAAACRWSSAARRRKARRRDRASRARRDAGPSPIGALRSGCSAACRRRCPGPAARSAATCRATSRHGAELQLDPRQPLLERVVQLARETAALGDDRAILPPDERVPIGVHPGPDQAGDQRWRRRTRPSTSECRASTTAARPAATMSRRRSQQQAKRRRRSRFEDIDAGHRHQRAAAESRRGRVGQGIVSRPRTRCRPPAAPATAPPGVVTSVSSDAIDAHQLGIVRGGQQPAGASTLRRRHLRRGRRGARRRSAAAAWSSSRSGNPATSTMSPGASVKGCSVSISAALVSSRT